MFHKLLNPQSLTFCWIHPTGISWASLHPGAVLGGPWGFSGLWPRQFREGMPRFLTQILALPSQLGRQVCVLRPSPACVWWRDLKSVSGISGLLTPSASQSQCWTHRLVDGPGASPRSQRFAERRRVQLRHHRPGDHPAERNLLHAQLSGPERWGPSLGASRNSRLTKTPRFLWPHLSPLVSESNVTPALHTAQGSWRDSMTVWVSEGSEKRRPIPYCQPPPLPALLS